MYNKETYIQRGNTIRLTATFRDWGGDPVDPDTVKVLIYSREWVKIDEFTLSLANRTDTGRYYLDYIAEQVGTFYVEWNGMIDAMPSVHRSGLIVKSI